MFENIGEIPAHVRYKPHDDDFGEDFVDLYIEPAEALLKPGALFKFVIDVLYSRPGKVSHSVEFMVKDNSPIIVLVEYVHGKQF